jgi:amidohydrolase
MSMDKYLEEIHAEKDQVIADRRTIHEHAEVGMDLPQTVAYIENQLAAAGIASRRMGGGMVCEIGQGSPMILLRADMDALPQTEESGLPFACKTGANHSCGHDSHAAMLLGVARVLKKHEAELKGTVRLMFQPGEEKLAGARAMIAAGVLEDPRPDAAMALHIFVGPHDGLDMRPGNVVFPKSTVSGDRFEITVHGKSAHCAEPDNGINALQVAAEIINALFRIPNQEVNNQDPVLVAIGQCQAGTAPNIIPGEAKIIGNVRTNSPQTRARMKERIAEVAQGIASAWRASADVVYTGGTAPYVPDPALQEEMAVYMAQVADKVIYGDRHRGGEDFGEVCAAGIPTLLTYVCAGGPEQGYDQSLHSTSMRFDEDAMETGVRVLVHCAVQWLQAHQK